MKLLTFLGVAKYQETCYTWQDMEQTSRFAPVASCHFLKPDALIVFLTEDAEDQVFPDFRAALPDGLKIQPVPVPLGKDEQELWRIFEQVSSAVQPGEEVAFDITHGLRSFPLVGLLVAAFLRAGMDVSLKAVLYGAYDVGRVVSPGFTPMFDLSPMLSLLEWTTAADRFNRTGDARYLASLVESQRKDLALAAEGEPELLQEVGYLGNLAGALTSISQSLRLIRPHQAMEQIAGLPERTKKAEPALQRTATARPFSLVLDSIVQAYKPLAKTDPLSPENIRSTLAVERDMIHWFAEREQWVQSVSLAREWLVSWVMVHLGLTSITQLNARHRIESVVGSEANDFKVAKKMGRQGDPIFLANLPNAKDIFALWLELTDVRNDIDHAGMREDPGKPKDLINRIEGCIKQIDTLPL